MEKIKMRTDWTVSRSVPTVASFNMESCRSPQMLGIHHVVPTDLWVDPVLCEANGHFRTEFDIVILTVWIKSGQA